MQIPRHHLGHLTPETEVTSRIRALQESLQKARVPIAWLDDIPSLYYFTGSTQDGVLLVPAVGSLAYYVRKSLERAVAESPLKCLPHPGKKVLVQKAIDMADGVALGMDLFKTRASNYRRFLDVASKLKIVDMGSILRSLRMVKSPWEVDQIRRATHLGEVGFTALAKRLVVGISELDLCVEVEKALRLNGHQGLVRCVDPHFELTGSSVVSGSAARYPTNNNGSLGSTGLFPGSTVGAGKRSIESGETVMADIACAFNGYNSDNTRVFSADARLGPETTRAHDFCLECLGRIETLLKPGAICSEIYNEVNDWAAAKGKPEGFMGFAENNMSFFGHGVGIELDEAPVIAERVSQILEAGMVLAIEPKAYLQSGPVGVENTYVITESGCESLCTYDRSITICGN
jgi:Xaa-Pro aminopeptidase